ncbi:MAG: SPASM domain-containing protein, partial [Clostridia bacterium]|nr:SPASM domain-containing protein [Clostridia bacterium]
MLRKTPNGKGSFDIIVPNAKKLIERRGDKEYYVRGTFTNHNLDFVNDVKALDELGFERISIEPVVLADDDELALREEHLKRIFDEYEELTRYLSEKQKNGKHLIFFHFMLDMGHGPCLKKRIKGCGAGVEYVAVTPAGDIYPCHQFVGEEEFKMGSVVTGELNQDIQSDFAKCNILTKKECSECWAKYFCSGGCAANAYKYNGSIYKPHKVTCELLKKRTECGAALYAEAKINA